MQSYIYISFYRYKLLQLSNNSMIKRERERERLQDKKNLP